jgi:hypothetical protein
MIGGQTSIINEIHDPRKPNLVKWTNNYFLMLRAQSYVVGYRDGFEAAYDLTKMAETKDHQSNKVYDLADLKKLIKQYFEEHHGDTIDYVDLTEAFEFPLALVVQACEELEREGKIAAVD